MKHFLVVLALLSCAMALSAQATDTLPPVDEEDYSLYDAASFTDAGARRYCSPKILDLSPQRFLSLAWDAQLPYTMQSSLPGMYEENQDFAAAEQADVRYTGGLRLSANIPVISKSSVVWQLGANFWDTRYRMQNRVTTYEDGLQTALAERGLRTMGLNSTLFKPLNDKQFLYFQAAADLSGDYTFSDMQSLRYLRYSAAAVWGKRPSDFKMWGVGLARTYRVGEMNYIPVFLFNWTAPNRKWGTEILFPARGHVRYTFNPRSLMLAGFELEGQSHRIQRLSTPANSFEVRRGELRLRAEYQRQIKGFVWLSTQVGLRHNWNFNADQLASGREFFRGFFGDQPYAMRSTLGNPLYVNIGIHLVSP